MILETNYQAFDEDMGESFEISLLDMRAYGLISINISALCLYIIYVTYQLSNNKVKDIYNYFKYNPNFRNISIEDSFKLGIERLTKLDDFFLEWIEFLSRVQGDIEYRLLKEAFIYTNYIGYEKYIDQITKNQPKIYIDIFNYLQKENKINELIDLGNKVLKTIDNNLKIGSDIALYLANINESKKEEYICNAFNFDTSVLNLLRNNIYEIWKKWKSNFKIDESLKIKIIKWLKMLIEKRVEAIMEGNYRKSYYKVALLVVAYGEMISSQNLGTKEEYIKYFTDKYSRRSAFKSEINELI